MERSGKEVHARAEGKKTVVHSGIRCPECASKTMVLNSVPVGTLNKHGRYRECTVCTLRFYTEEEIKRITTSKVK